MAHMVSRKVLSIDTFVIEPDIRSHLIDRPNDPSAFIDRRKITVWSARSDCPPLAAPRVRVVEERRGARITWKSPVGHSRSSGDTIGR